MKSFATLVLAALPLALADCPANGNNCARAVTGTRKAPDQASRSADCSSFMKATVTPAATTVTATVTVTVNAKRGLEARQTTVVPSAIPSYAAAACSAAAYSSVCSCWGITATTVTVATPTVTVTATATTTAVADCPGGGATCGSYVVYSCPESASGRCTCGIDANGATVCWSVGTCSDPSCSTNAECGAGKVCITSTCCGNLCQVVAPAGRCTNPNQARSIFGRKAVPRAAGCEASPIEAC